MKNLLLTLNRDAFEVMVTGEKKLEYRQDSKWIRSRLYNKDGSVREYDTITFRNGYGERPYFVCKFGGIAEKVEGDIWLNYSNGLAVDVTPETHIIKCGEIIETGNLEMLQK